MVTRETLFAHLKRDVPLLSPVMRQAVLDTVMGLLNAEDDAPGAPQQEASGDDKRWAAYVANMIETYLQFDQPKRNPSDQRIAAIAGIIERRMMFLTRAAATAPAGGVTDAWIESYMRSLREQGRKLTPGVASYWLTAEELRDMLAALTTAARTAEPAIQLGADGQKVFAETLLNPPPPTAAFLKAEESYSNLAQPEATAPAGGVTDDATELLTKYKALCIRVGRGDSYHLGRIDAAIDALTTAARATEPEKWTAACYDDRQRAWCARYEHETGFEPLMDDFEAGNQTFVEAAQASTRWYEDHTNDAYLRITDGAIPGSEFDDLAVSPTPPTGTSQEGGEHGA